VNASYPQDLGTKRLSSAQTITSSGHRRRRNAGTSAQVRAARERLSNGDGLRPEYEYELLTTFARNELEAIFTIPLLAIVCALASSFWAPTLQAFTWLGFVLAAKIWLLHSCRQLLGKPHAEVNVAAWRKRLIRIELLYGVTWAGIAFLGLGVRNETAPVFIFSALIVVLAMRTILASSMLQIVYAGTIPMTAAVVFRLLSVYDPFHWALASLAVGVHVYFVFLAKRLRVNEMARIDYRAEKDSLFGELEQSKAISDEARRRAEEANIAKSRFLATMSHELRTPLNAILGFSEVMKAEMMGPLKNDTYKEYAGNIHDSGRHLLHLINEILDLSRIEAGRYELNEEPIQLIDIADDCLRLLKLRAENKGLELIEHLDEHLPQVWADERALRQIVLNLLSNALKFTPRGGRIELTIGMTEDGGQALSVKDNGPGIPEDELPKVMLAFGQGSLAHKTAEGGTGLGLPIVRNLVELHGGTFELRSQLRKGTEAIVFFPKKRVLHRMAPLQPLGAERHRRQERRLDPNPVAAEVPPRRPRRGSVKQMFEAP
jgi:two-component system, cell cycle sensor histidine kinase PleC